MCRRRDGKAVAAKAYWRNRTRIYTRVVDKVGTRIYQDQWAADRENNAICVGVTLKVVAT